MNKELVVERLKNGQELINRGTGWWIAEPYKPYTSQESTLVDEAVVDELASAGVIEYVEHSWSYSAVLVDNIK